MRVSSPSSAKLRPSSAWTETISKAASATGVNAVLAAAGFNFGPLLRWLAELLRAIIQAFARTVPAQKIALSGGPAFFSEHSIV